MTLFGPLGEPISPPIPPPPRAEARSGALTSLLESHWFIRLRWAFVAVALAALALERFISPAAVRPPLVVVPILLLALVNLVWMSVERSLLERLRRLPAEETRITPSALRFANAQVGVDLLVLTLILRYTGGVENPLALFYLLHMSISALLLRPWHAVGQGAWAVLLFAAVGVGELSGWISPHYEFLPQVASPGLYARIDYVAAALVVMAAGVFAMLYFTLHITGRLERRERELYEAHAALRQSGVAMADLQQRRARLLQVAAHQLKGPLVSIETLAGLLADSVVPPEALARTYERIRQRCREGVQQVTELLTLARVQRADPSRHRHSVCDVARVAREVCTRYAAVAEGKGVRLDLHLPEYAETSALVDPADLTDCLSNLLDNAIKYTPGPGTVSVTVGPVTAVDQLGRRVGGPESGEYAEGDAREAIDAAPLPGDQVAVTVTDTGMGLDAQSIAEIVRPEENGSVFDAFRRGNNALEAAIPGTGLGLAIVREVVEQSGGRIYVRSRKGKGSSFTVTFPTQESAAVRPLARDTRSSVRFVGPGAPAVHETLSADASRPKPGSAGVPPAVFS